MNKNINFVEASFVIFYRPEGPDLVHVCGNIGNISIIYKKKSDAQWKYQQCVNSMIINKNVTDRKNAVLMGSEKRKKILNIIYLNIGSI